MCNGKDHDLVDIMFKNMGFDEDAVVRWCKYCGAIVVDSDFDSRTNPGCYKKMMFPEILSRVKEHKVDIKENPLKFLDREGN